MAERLSLIAGTGALVPEVIAAARGRGYQLQVLSLQSRRVLHGTAATPFDLGRPEQALDSLRAFRPTMIVLAGGLSLSDRARERLLAFIGGGTGALGDTGLSAFTSFLTRATGAPIVGVQDIASGLLAPAGQIAGPPPSDELAASGAFALALAREAGRLDMGQSLVVSGRRTIAAEDIAGTDALLRRVASYRRFGLAADGASALVLAKAAKPDQPHAVDLPAIGPRTIANARRAGIALIVVQAGATILIERQKLVRAADAARLPIFGLAVDHG